MKTNRHYNEQPLKEVIRDFLERTGLEKKFDELEVVRCYHEVMGPAISKHTEKAFVRGRTLVVTLDSGALKEELSFGKSKLVQLINEKLGADAISEIEIR